MATLSTKIELCVVCTCTGVLEQAPDSHPTGMPKPFEDGVPTVAPLFWDYGLSGGSAPSCVPGVLQERGISCGSSKPLSSQPGECPGAAKLCTCSMLLLEAADSNLVGPWAFICLFVLLCGSTFDAVLGRSYCPLTLDFWRRDTSAPHAPGLNRSPLPSHRNMQLPDSAKEAFTTSCVTAMDVGKGDDVKHGCRSNLTSG